MLCFGFPQIKGNVGIPFIGYSIWFVTFFLIYVASGSSVSG